ncbi:hypothetical protein C4579_02185 [Candidatus Microgenomates bacterium]|nr:MAG: hypothetical protein C4579_02185 [Candidatus Microgenomates bacterium]
MATLTETAFYARKYIKWGAVGLVVFLTLRLLFNITLNYIRTTFPPKVEPNNYFQVLPAITFPKSASPSADMNFRLETISGGLPTTPEIARVFFMPKDRANLLSLSNAQTFVGKLGFTTSPHQLTETKYRWTDLKSPLRTIEMDIVSNRFSLVYLYQHDLSLFNEKNIPTTEEAISEAASFFKNLGVVFYDIDTINPRTQYLRLVGNQLQPASSQSQADAIRVDFFRLPIDRHPVVTDTFTKGNVSIILTGARDQNRRVISATYHYWPVLSDSPALYKLKTAEEAWLEFLGSRTYIAQVPDPITGDIIINNMYVAYFDSDASQTYLQPVFVIQGENNFAAYVPAIAPPWSEEPILSGQ